MTDYECSPLWLCDGDIGNVSPESLPLSESLILRLLDWAAAFDKTLNQEDPAASGFSSVDHEIQFEETGRLLWLELRAELGPTWTIQYFAPHSRQLHTDP